MIWDRILDIFRAAQPVNPDHEARLAHAGELAAQEAERLWKLDVIDPRQGSTDPRAHDSLTAIRAIVSLSGWGHYVANGQGPQWCGMTAGWCWAHAGLDPSWLSAYWASTYRLGAWARYERWSPTAKANPRPLGVVTSGDERRKCIKLSGWPALTATEVRRGDVLIVGDGTPSAGDHVTIVVGYDGDGRYDTISGNGGGVGPHGDKREGISRREYRSGAPSGYRPLWLIRPGVGDIAHPQER